MLFVIAAVYAILRPDDTTVLANWLGVDRGADLLTYALAIAFVFTTLSTYLRFKGSNCATPGWPARSRCRTRTPTTKRTTRTVVRCPLSDTVLPPVAAAAVVLVGLQLLLRAVLAFGGYFYWDDLIIVGRAGPALLSAAYLFTDHDGHVMPAAFLLGGVTTHWRRWCGSGRR